MQTQKELLLEENRQLKQQIKSVKDRYEKLIEINKRYEDELRRLSGILFEGDDKVRCVD